MLVRDTHPWWLHTCSTTIGIIGLRAAAELCSWCDTDLGRTAVAPPRRMLPSRAIRAAAAAAFIIAQVVFGKGFLGKCIASGAYGTTL